MVKIIERNGGHIDNCAGDGMRVIFGAEGQEDAPIRAGNAPCRPSWRAIA